MSLIFCLALTGCAPSEAPHGKWEGFGESMNWLIAVRLEVKPGNVIRASALSAEVTGLTLPRRMELEAELKSGIVSQWSTAATAEIAYQGNTIVRKDGYAPLFVFEPGSRRMRFHFYANGRLTETVSLKPVEKFGPR